MFAYKHLTLLLMNVYEFSPIRQYREVGNAPAAPGKVTITGLTVTQ